MNSIVAIMYDVADNANLKIAVKSKTDFELAREFVLWSPSSDESQKIIALELYSRSQWISLITIACVGLLTNTLMFLLEALYSSRWLIFEEKSSAIFKQYLLGFISLSLLPIILGIPTYLENKTFTGFLITALIIYSIAVIIGIVKIAIDCKSFISLTK